MPYPAFEYDDITVEVPQIVYEEQGHVQHEPRVQDGGLPLDAVAAEEMGRAGHASPERPGPGGRQGAARRRQGRAQGTPQSSFADSCFRHQLCVGSQNSPQNSPQDSPQNSPKNYP